MHGKVVFGLFLMSLWVLFELKLFFNYLVILLILGDSNKYKIASYKL